MENNGHKFPYIWRLADGFPAKGIEYHGKKVFSCFCCGGGSSMGYKLAGYDCLGGVEIDPNIAKIYSANLHPKLLYNLDIRDFNKLDNLPAELYDLDVLDGSPPCTTFSTNGKREKSWGKEKKFAEGQKMQTLDDLVFVYCDTIAKLRPKVCVLENVEGLIKGNAIAYAKEIHRKLAAAGYRVQVFNLQAACMGVPSRRKRVFFVGLRNDYNLRPLKLEFDEPIIIFKKIKDNTGRSISSGTQTRFLWENRTLQDYVLGTIYERCYGVKKRYSETLLHDNEVAWCVQASAMQMHWSEPIMVSNSEFLKMTTFPIDYNTDVRVQFVTGMSVPPVMMAQIATKINEQWLSKM